MATSTVDVAAAAGIASDDMACDGMACDPTFTPDTVISIRVLLAAIRVRAFPPHSAAALSGDL